MTATSPRIRAARRQCVDVIARASSLAYDTTDVLDRSRQLQEDSRRIVADARCARIDFASRFRVEGSVDGEPVVATWSWGRLRGDELLLVRARLVVDLEDAFELGGVQGPLPASLDHGPLTALLTLVRACDTVTAVELNDAVMQIPPDGAALTRMLGPPPRR